MYNFMFITLTDTYFNELTICGFSCFSLDSLVWMYVTICIRMRVSSLFCRTNTLCRRKKGETLFIFQWMHTFLIPCSLVMKLRNIYNKRNSTKGNCTMHHNLQEKNSLSRIQHWSQARRQPWCKNTRMKVFHELLSRTLQKNNTTRPFL